MMDENEVLIVGAGPVGLLLACELRLAGIRVAVLERRGEAVAQSRSLTMHGRTVEMLALRGVAERFISRGRCLPSGHFAVLDTRLDFSVCDTTMPFTLLIPQSLTERLLESWALELGVAVHRRAMVERTEQDADGVLVQGSRDGEPFALRGQYLVGADGARSLVRRQAGIAFDGLPVRKTVMTGDVHLDAPPATPAISVTNAAGGFMLVALGDGLYRIVLNDAERMDIPLTEPVTFAELAHSVRRITGQDFGMRDPVWLSRFGDETRLAATYRQGRILLAGDAAHIHLPAGGQGMNVGMQDAMNLGWKLAAVLKGQAGMDLLDSYHGERQPVGQALYRNTLAQSALMTHFDPASLALRETISQWLKLPALNQHLAQQLSAFGVGYPAALTELAPGWLATPEWTGRRLPDWPLRLADGSASTLYRHLRQGNWLLLDLTDGTHGDYPHGLAPSWCQTLRASPTTALADVDFVLIRPDGHADIALSRIQSATVGKVK